MKTRRILIRLAAAVTFLLPLAIATATQSQAAEPANPPRHWPVTFDQLQQWDKAIQARVALLEWFQKYVVGCHVDVSGRVVNSFPEFPGGQYWLNSEDKKKAGASIMFSMRRGQYDNRIQPGEIIVLEAIVQAASDFGITGIVMHDGHNLRVAGPVAAPVKPARPVRPPRPVKVVPKLVRPPSPPQPIYPVESQLMVQAATAANVGSVRTGKQHPILEAAAQAHAQYMASCCVQGHQHWDQRKSQIEQQMPGCNAEEVAAESWDHQSQAESAPEMFHCWRQSPGHWAEVNGSCDFYGYSMARGRNGIHYGCGIVAKLRRRQ